MDQFNKALSFILGLVVVAVFIVVASGKFNFKGLSLPKSKTAINTTPKPTSKPWFSFNQPTTKPTAKPTSTPKINTLSKGGVQQQNQQDPNYRSYSGSQVPTSIPNTGVPIVLFPLFGTSLLTGIFMRKTGKKE
ncbi:hypothetical protein COZ40_01295 [Candidatus Roizmanbacteria bacterium CG_4_10_14_3_um_filter_39_13]|uniref:Uncharacterized protein n=2 Tax=Candidatus Roizmaniibacteriota TaxID=1752723 RepID=A0A2M7LL58_9BACT|nr:MAG: hypothetical protein COS52_02795 [Candidatus Roizmanbacteria bacterium CG03_land_8_20_14_0_80_39_12]PIX68811.1 MAG: hypothetical protein COZ40_01295 [Candidatus Roizmanbacteria bacterium CG_4_10_14_3_um_filter_39_13]